MSNNVDDHSEPPLPRRWWGRDMVWVRERLATALGTKESLPLSGTTGPRCRRNARRCSATSADVATEYSTSVVWSAGQD